MQMVVEATGYQMGGIYRHFDSKMDLAQAVFQFTYQTLIRRNFEFEEGQSPREKLLSILAHYQRMIFKPTVAGGCPILNATTEADDTHEAFRELVKSSFEEILDILMQVLEEGKTRQAFRPELDARKEALYLIATFEGAIMIGQLTKSARPMLDIFKQLERYLEAQVFVQKDA